jgi:hypothetical protein
VYDNEKHRNTGSCDIVCNNLTRDELVDGTT